MIKCSVESAVQCTKNDQLEDKIGVDGHTIQIRESVITPVMLAEATFTQELLTSLKQRAF